MLDESPLMGPNSQKKLCLSNHQWQKLRRHLESHELMKTSALDVDALTPAQTEAVDRRPLIQIRFQKYACDVLRHERRHSVAKHLVQIGPFLVAEVEEVREGLHPGRLSNREAACQLRMGETALGRCTSSLS